MVIMSVNRVRRKTTSPQILANFEKQAIRMDGMDKSKHGVRDRPWAGSRVPAETGLASVVARHEIQDL